MKPVEFTRNFREEAEMLVEVWASSREADEEDKALVLEKVLRNEGMVREVKELYGPAAALRLISGVEIAGDSWRGKFRMLDEGEVLRRDEKYYVLDGDFKAEEMPVVNSDLRNPSRTSDNYVNRPLGESAAGQNELFDARHEVEGLEGREKLLRKKIVGAVRTEITRLRREAARYKENFEVLVEGVRDDSDNLRGVAREFKASLAYAARKDARALRKKRNGFVQRMGRDFGKEKIALRDRYEEIRQKLVESVSLELAEIKGRSVNFMARARNGVKGKVEDLRRKVEDAESVQDLLAINPKVYSTTSVGVGETKRPTREVIPIHPEYNPEVDYRCGITDIPESVVVTRILGAYEPSSGVLNRAMKLVTPLVNSPGLVRRVWEAHRKEIQVGVPGNSVDPDWYRKVMEPWVRDNKWIKNYYRGKT